MTHFFANNFGKKPLPKIRFPMLFLWDENTHFCIITNRSAIGDHPVSPSCCPDKGQVVQGGARWRVAWAGPHNSILTPASPGRGRGPYHGIRFTALGVTSVRKFSNMRWSIAVSSRHTNYSTSAKIFLV